MLSLSFTWVLCLLGFLVVAIHPPTYKLLLCMLYLFGPLNLVWTSVATVGFVLFQLCCVDAQTECQQFYAYTHSANITVLLAISLVFSLVVSIVLVLIVMGPLWQRLSQGLRGYVELL